MGEDSGKMDLDRRQFIRGALITSAAAAAADRGFSAATPSPGAMTAAPYALFAPLPPGAVRPAGWLQTYLEKQAAQLGSQLGQVSWPFTGAYWAGDEDAVDERGKATWWPWEQRGYWIDGMTRLALVLGDKQLQAQARAPLEYTLSHAGADGYLGSQYIKTVTGGFARWPQTIFFRALAAASDANMVSGVPQAMLKHYLHDNVDYSEALRNITNVEDMLWCYERTGDARLLDMGDKAWRDFEKNAGGKERFPTRSDHCDLSPRKVYADEPIYSHGVDYIEAAKQPAILYLYTGQAEYLRFALAAQRRIFDYHILIDGIPSTSEFYRYQTALDSHETCDITDHTWSWGYMLMATGDGIWGDRVERALFNAGFGALKKDWKGLQYFSFPNQVGPTSFRPNPGGRVACCGGNIHRLFPNYVIRMWMKDPAGGLAATFYGPSTVKAAVGPEHQEIEIVQETDYPFGEQIHFTIHTQKAVTFPLSLRIPGWSSNASLMINGQPIEMPAIKKGFATLSRQFKSGDTVTLVLPMKPLVTRWPQNGIGIEHGPLVYALAVKEDWTSKVEPKYSTEAFPCWQATPASPWNYGMALEPGALESQVQLARRPMTQDPWVAPPVTLTVPVREIEDWELQPNPDNPNQKFTPPLPELSASKIGDSLQHVALTPYGSTHLRVTIFPDLGKPNRT